MSQPRIPQPPATWNEYRAGAAACLKRMSDEGRARALAFWKTNTPKPPKK